jgi:hypothetical protein
VLLKEQWVKYVVRQQGELKVGKKMLDIVPASGEEVVNAYYFITFVKEIFAEMTANEARAACD